MMGFAVEIDIRVLVATLFALHCFGWAYNAMVTALEKDGHDRGYMSFIVVGGVGITLGGILLITWSLWLGGIMLACFAASGLPMIVGSMRRHNQARDREDQETKQIVGDAINGD